MNGKDGLSNWLEIDLSAIAHNVKRMREIAGVRVMAVVKANGYGHGLIAAARTAVEAGAVYCGVARVDEALELRGAGLDARLLVLGETPTTRVREAIANDVSMAVFRHDHVEVLRSALRDGSEKANVHLKVDTGMSRLGADVERTFELLRRLHGIDRVHIEGLFTHFARADEPEVDTTAEQERAFTGLLEEITSGGMRPPLVHAANSAAALTRPSSRFDMVRPGIALYGLDPSDQVPLPDGFRRALRWKSRVSQIRDVPTGTGISYGHVYVAPGPARLGVVPVGYGDGYRRVEGNEVLVRGVKVPVRGRVCMDQVIVDLSDVPEVEVGDEVVLIGRQGQTAIEVDHLAAKWNTLNYEVVCGLGERVPRLAVG